MLYAGRIAEMTRYFGRTNSRDQIRRRCGIRLHESVGANLVSCSTRRGEMVLAGTTSSVLAALPRSSVQLQRAYKLG